MTNDFKITEINFLNRYNKIMHKSVNHKKYFHQQIIFF
jgi:hypothetical protein